MQKYFITTSEMVNKTIINSDVFHITNVMRNRIGDKLIVNDENNEFLVEITEMTKNSVVFSILEEINGTTEMPFFITLFQGFPKGDKLDEIIKHSVELGICEICPIFTKRSIVKIDNDRISNKLIRYNRIAKEAAEQSNRKRLPKITSISDLKKIDFSSYNHKIVCYEESAKNSENKLFKKIIKEFKPLDKVAIVIGPEGGLDSLEIEDLIKNGFIPVGLGKRILRTETAIMYVLSAISYEWELDYV